MLWSLNLYQQFSGDMHSSWEITHQLMQLAEDLKDSALTTEAHVAIASLLVLLGRHSEGLEHLEKGTELHAAHPNHGNSVFANLDSRVMCECFTALALFALGYPDQSSKTMAVGLALARELGHPETFVVAGHIAAQLHQLRGEASLSYERAKEAMELADEYGLAFWAIYGLIEVGWAIAELGNPHDGIEKMRKGSGGIRGNGGKTPIPVFSGAVG